jgi:hypothetical protein
MQLRNDDSAWNCKSNEFGVRDKIARCSQLSQYCPRVSNTKATGWDCHKTVGIVDTAAHYRQSHSHRRVPPSLLSVKRERRVGEGPKIRPGDDVNKGIDVPKLRE